MRLPCVRQLRYAAPCGHNFLSGHTIFSCVHTKWKNLRDAGLRYTSHSCCYIRLRPLSRCPKHKRECRKGLRCLRLHGIFFSFSPDAPSFQNGKKQLTVRLFCRGGTKPDSQPVPQPACGSSVQNPFTCPLNVSDRQAN